MSEELKKQEELGHRHGETGECHEHHHGEAGECHDRHH